MECSESIDLLLLVSNAVRDRFGPLCHLAKQHFKPKQHSKHRQRQRGPQTTDIPSRQQINSHLLTFWYLSYVGLRVKSAARVASVRKFEYCKKRSVCEPQDHFFGHFRLGKVYLAAEKCKRCSQNCVFEVWSNSVWTIPTKLFNTSYKV